MSTSFITPGISAPSGRDTQMQGNVSLASCLINGKPGVVLVLVDHAGEGKVAIMPLFVAITKDMDIVFENVTSDGAVRAVARGSCLLALAKSALLLTERLGPEQKF